MLNYAPSNRQIRCGLGLISATVLLSACDGAIGTVLPDGVTASDVALFKSAVAAEGCMITNDTQGDAVQAATGFDDDKLSIITQYLTLAGESEPATTGFRLTSGQCANA